MFIIQVLQDALERGSPDCAFVPQAFQESVFISLITGAFPTVHPEQKVKLSYPKHILLPVPFCRHQQIVMARIQEKSLEGTVTVGYLMLFLRENP